MRDGFIKVSAVTPNIRVADVDYNYNAIVALLDKAIKEKSKVIVFPELSLSGYTCHDLFLQDRLLDECKNALIKLAEYSTNYDCILFVGLPIEIEGKLYNVAAAINKGKILGLIPKHYLPNYNEFYEARQFCSGKNLNTSINIGRQIVPVSEKIMFTCNEMSSLRIAAEICEDVWVSNSPSIYHALNGANLIVNLSASNEIVGKSNYRKQLVSNHSAKIISGYIYACSGPSESTQDVVYSGHNLIAENGRVLAESKLFFEGIISAELDMKRLDAERRRWTTFESFEEGNYKKISFSLKEEQTKLTRFIDPHPFVPKDNKERKTRCEDIINIQAYGLKKRFEHINAKTALIGVSGGLDSTLALMVIVKAFDLMGLDRKGIIAVTMPGFGTTTRTYENAVKLINAIGATFKEISIVEAVNVHFKDIGHDQDVFDVTYENSQARERTQILMDLANKYNGIVIGTGDLSELALGWATYNGDHMSNYAVNVSIPKTLVKYLVKYFADIVADKVISNCLNDILATPISPELLPTNGKDIVQKTEDIVGPYELHDFFIFNMLRYGSSPSKIYRLAKIAFKGTYDELTILKWEKVFYKRFFSQQFKRSCLPDGPKVGSIAISPRGDLRMPSDASASTWLKELENL